MKMSNARAGREREYAAREALVKHGYRPVLRAAGSKGSADILMGRPGEALWIQVGSASKRLGPADRARICLDAALFNAVPLLAVVVPRRPVVFCRVHRDGFSEWSPNGIVEASGGFLGHAP